MRWSLLVLVTACGRIGIDPVAQIADGATVDSTPRICVTDGDACDDGNICTDSSHCANETCVADTPVATCRVADSAMDFDTVQGTNGWYYGYWFESADPDETYSASDFTPFTLHAGDLWRPADYADTGPTFTWAYLASWGGHPGELPEKKLPIRRWVSSVSGAANLRVKLAKSDTSGGDGTRAIVFVDGVEVFRKDVGGTDGVGFTIDVPVQLQVGTKVDYMLHYVLNEAQDTSDTSMRIASP